MFPQIVFDGVSDSKQLQNQVKVQVYGLLLSLAIALLGGSLSGFFASKLSTVELFSDKAHFKQVEKARFSMQQQKEEEEKLEDNEMQELTDFEFLADLSMQNSLDNN